MGDCLSLFLNQRKTAFNFDEDFIKIFDEGSDTGYTPQVMLALIRLNKKI